VENDAKYCRSMDSKQVQNRGLENTSEEETKDLVNLTN